MIRSIRITPDDINKAVCECLDAGASPEFIVLNSSDFEHIVHTVLKPAHDVSHQPMPEGNSTLFGLRVITSEDVEPNEFLIG